MTRRVGTTNWRHAHEVTAGRQQRACARLVLRELPSEIPSRHGPRFLARSPDFHPISDPWSASQGQRPGAQADRVGGAAHSHPHRDRRGPDSHPPPGRTWRSGGERRLSPNPTVSRLPTRADRRCRGVASVLEDARWAIGCRPLGHSTVLVDLDGVRVLTGPLLGHMDLASLRALPGHPALIVPASLGRVVAKVAHGVIHEMRVGGRRPCIAS
jgi:hypothetical protein